MKGLVKALFWPALVFGAIGEMFEDDNGYDYRIINLLFGLYGILYFSALAFYISALVQKNIHAEIILPMLAVFGYMIGGCIAGARSEYED